MTQKDNLNPDEPKIPSFTAEQVKNLVNLTRFQLGEKIVSMVSEMKLNMHHMIRYLPVARYCQKTREQKNLSLKEIGLKLKVPKYKLKAIEETALHEIKYEILIQYVKFLGIEKEFEEWAQANQDIMEEISSVRDK